jgi:hypothetical protein
MCQQMLSCVWHGVWRAVTVMCFPSVKVLLCDGVLVTCGQSVPPWLGWGWVLRISALPPAWSQWWCVLRIFVRVRVLVAEARMGRTLGGG